MKIKNSILLLIVALLVISCDKNRAFDEYKSVENSWHKDSIVSFELPQLNAEKKYNLFVTLRDNNDYPFNNLFLIVPLLMNHQLKRSCLVGVLSSKISSTQIKTRRSLSIP